MDITFYTIECPKCQILKKKMDAKNISYKTCSDIEIMRSKGMEEMPMLEVNGKLMNFAEANKWIGEYNAS